MLKTVYVGMSADIIHPGHLKIIKKAASLGKVVVGVLSDEAIASYKRVPYLPLDTRLEIISALKDVDQVIIQKTLDYSDNLRLLRPDFVVHGDDWKEGLQAATRQNVLSILAEWDGKLIEVPYTDGISSTAIQAAIKSAGITADSRKSSLRRLLQVKPLLRFLDIHNALSALIIEHTTVERDDGFSAEFDGMWASSLTDSTAKGKPDIEAVDHSSRMNTLHEVLEVTTKPIIFDGDTGGKPEHFAFNLRTLERLGISAVIIEDKTGLKKNSLFGNDVLQQQESIEDFSHKISVGKAAQATDEFMVIARLESLILQKGVDDAIERANAYIAAGADGIMIHSRSSTPDEIFEFIDRYNKFSNRKPLVVVPSTFNSVTEAELIERGVNIVIYANHLLRSAFPAMQMTARSILKHERSLECDEALMSIDEILDLVPGTR